MAILRRNQPKARKKKKKAQGQEQSHSVSVFPFFLILTKEDLFLWCFRSPILSCGGVLVTVYKDQDESQYAIKVAIVSLE